MRKKMIVLAAFVLLVSACVPGQSQQDIEGRVNTAVAQTMEANNHIVEAVGQTVAAQIPAATPTLNVTATFERVQIVTDTPFSPAVTFTDTPPPTLPELPAFDTDTPVPPVTQQPYSCFVLTIKPDHLEEINAGANFEIRWNVKNTGTNTWDAGIDLKYASGVKMTNPERVEISKSLSPGDSYKISLNGKAPKHTGVQQMTWIVEGQLCYANVIITVK